jgi:hypothetical protein
MALWGLIDNAANSVKGATELTGDSVGSGNANKAANNTALYHNTTVGAFVPGKVAGQWSVSAAALANTQGEAKKTTHAGWIVRSVGTGPVTAAVVTAGGTTYTNTDVITVSGGTTNATFTPVTNSTGGIISTTPTSPGYGFKFSNVAVFSVANSSGGATTGSGATFTATLGGRAGRVTHETIVAQGSNPTTTTAIFPV